MYAQDERAAQESALAVTEAAARVDEALTVRMGTLSDDHDRSLAELLDNVGQLDEDTINQKRERLLDVQRAEKATVDSEFQEQKDAARMEGIAESEAKAAREKLELK